MCTCMGHVCAGIEFYTLYFLMRRTGSRAREWLPSVLALRWADMRSNRLVLCRHRAWFRASLLYFTCTPSMDCSLPLPGLMPFAPMARAYRGISETTMWNLGGIDSVGNVVGMYTPRSVVLASNKATSCLHSGRLQWRCRAAHTKRTCFSGTPPAGRARHRPPTHQASNDQTNAWSSK